MKNLMVDQADAFDLSLSEYLSMLVVRDGGGVDGV